MRETEVHQRSDIAIARNIFLALLFVFVAVAGGHFYSMDDYTNHAVVESLITRGSVEVMLLERHLNVVPGREGRLFSYYGIGGPLIYSAFYLPGRIASLFLGKTAFLPMASMALTNSFLTAMTAAFLFLLLRSFNHSLASSRAAAFLYALATPAFVWAKHSSNTVMVGFLFVSAAWCVVSNRSLLAGLLLGLAVNVRYDAAIGAVIIPLIMGARYRRLAAGAIPFVLLLLSFNWSRFGSPFTIGYPDIKDGAVTGGNVLNGLFGLLFSPYGGILVFSPLLVLLPTGWKTLKLRELFLFVLLPAVYVLLYALNSVWHGGFGWSCRYLAVILPLLCGGLAAGIAHRRMILFPLLVLSVCIQLWGSLVSVDSVHDYLVEKGVDPVMAFKDPSLSPLIGVSWILKDLEWTRPEFSGDAPLKPGGYPATVNLRYTLDYWPFYAWKAGLPGMPLFASWLCVALAAGYFFRKAMEK